ncbi:MAG: energy transducer TonB [Vicinamibacterales bacterium]
MSILFADARPETRPAGRSTAAVGLSVACHTILAGVAVVITIGAPNQQLTPKAPSITAFVMPATTVATMPPPPVTPRPAPPTPTPVRQPARAVAPPPIPVPPIVPKATGPTPTPLVAEPAPVVTRHIERPVVQPLPETGLFERTQGARPSQAAATVTTGGFGSAAAVRAESETGAVTTGAFGSAPRSPRTSATGEVQTAGFERASASARPATAPATPIDQRVEITFKPTPEYSTEARNASIEGTVSLELEFTATGEVRVIRIVRGLGYGLDEAARRAALGIRFKPAQSDGRPVDSRATVHITFRLS